MDSFANPPVPGQLERAAGLRASEQHDDRDRRLRQARHAARKGVRRHRAAGSTLPIVYGEFGVETIDPLAEVHPLHGHGAGLREAGRHRDAGPLLPRRARASRSASRTCRRSSSSTRSTRANLDRWQSGIYYVDGTAKSSLAVVEDATRDTRGGVIAKCQGLSLTPKGKVVYPQGPTVKTVPLKVSPHVRHRLRLPRAARALSARLDDALDARRSSGRRRDHSCACRHVGWPRDATGSP